MFCSVKLNCVIGSGALFSTGKSEKTYCECKQCKKDNIK